MARTERYNNHMNIESSDEDQLFIPRLIFTIISKIWLLVCKNEFNYN